MSMVLTIDDCFKSTIAMFLAVKRYSGSFFAISDFPDPASGTGAGARAKVLTFLRAAQKVITFALAPAPMSESGSGK